jgi:hypothetical protein
MKKLQVTHKLTVKIEILRVLDVKKHELQQVQGGAAPSQKGGCRPTSETE